MSKTRVLVFVVVAGMTMASSPAWAAFSSAADWKMDETSGQMIDSSGNTWHFRSP